MAFTLFKLTIDPSTVPANNADRLALERALGEQCQKTPLTSYRHWIHPSNPHPQAGATSYKTRVLQAGGEEWNEIVTYWDPANPDGPQRIFTVGNFPADLGWLKGQYVLMREIRDLVDRLVLTYGVTNILAEWS